MQNNPSLDGRLISLDMSLKGLVHRRVSFFSRKCFEKKFALKCYEVVLYTSMN